MATEMVKANLKVCGLHDMEISEIEVALKSFTQRVEGQYQVYLLDEEQGRGLDFPSNSEIEANGGVYLIVACLPQRFLQYSQFLGRTGRLGNKGQYSVVLFDKAVPHSDGSFYLKQKLEYLKNQEILIVTNLSNESAAVNNEMGPQNNASHQHEKQREAE